MLNLIPDYPCVQTYTAPVRTKSLGGRKLPSLSHLGYNDYGKTYSLVRLAVACMLVYPSSEVFKGLESRLFDNELKIRSMYS